MAGQYDALRERLLVEKKRLQNDLEQLRASGPQAEERREGSPFGKREEEATESLELERRLALEKQTREHLAEVEASLIKFEDSTYGKCENCGRTISRERLEALPEAKQCVKCKGLLAKNARGRFPSS